MEDVKGHTGMGGRTPGAGRPVGAQFQVIFATTESNNQHRKYSDYI